MTTEAKDTTPAPQREFETLIGGTDVKVQFEDGTDELVKVRKIPLREMSLLAAVWANEEKEIAVYVRRQDGKVDAAWLDRIDETSWELLMREGRRINFTRFTAYFARQQQAMEAMGQLGTQAMEAAARLIARPG